MGNSTSADTLYHNGTILTLDANNTIGLGMIVADRKVARILHTPEEISAWKGWQVDLHGACIMPGFVLSHSHLSTYATLKHQVSVSPMNLFFDPNYVAPATSAEVLAKLNAAVQADPFNTQPLLAQGYDPILQPGAIISRTDLDHISPLRPVYLMSASMHDFYVNTATLQAAGLIETTLPDGTIILNQKVPLSMRLQVQNGRMCERAMQLLVSVMPTTSLEQMLSAIHDVAPILTAKGITTMSDATVSDPMWTVYREYSKLDPAFRMVGFPVYTPTSSFVSMGHASFIQPNYREYLTNDYLSIGPVKVIGDGSIEGYTAFLTEPYTTAPYFRVAHPNAWCGSPEFSQKYLRTAFTDICRANMSVAVHANGDACIDMILHAYRDACREFPNAERRSRIEHCTMLRTDQMDSLVELNLHPSFLINHVYYYGDAMVHRLIGPERGDRIDPVGQCVSAGIVADLHSDSPVTPPDPFFLVWVAVNRITSSGRVLDDGTQKASILDALKMVTVNPAWMLNLSNVGSLEPGKWADFLVLDANPLIVEPQKLKDIAILDTYVGGVRK